MVTAEAVDEYVQIQLAQHFFWEYCLWYDPEFYNRRPFLKKVAEALQWVYDEYMQGRARSITISMPPRSGKSYIVSCFCAWWLGKLPELSVMRNSSTSTLYEKLSYDTRKIVGSFKNKCVFPDVDLAGDKKNLSGWNLATSKQVGYFGAGAGGSTSGGQITGFGANLAIYDDLYKNLAEAMSPNVNEKILAWKTSDHNSRKELDCPEIGIGTRWRKNDVIGVEIERGNVDKKFEQAALIYGIDGYPDGKSFCENVNKTEFYLKEKRDLEPAIFDAMYMQEPVEMKGLLFPMSKLQKYNAKELGPQMDTLSIFRMGVIDPAKGGGDDFAFVVGYLIKDKVYLHDVMYNNDPSALNENVAVDFINKHKINKVYFEGNSAWYLMGETIRAMLQRQKSNCSFRIGEHTENKHTRILAQSQWIKNNVLFRDDWEQMEEYRKFMKNLTQYFAVGGNEHDDAPDALAELASDFRYYYKKLW